MANGNDDAERDTVIYYHIDGRHRPGGPTTAVQVAGARSGGDQEQQAVAGAKSCNPTNRRTTQPEMEVR